MDRYSMDPAAVAGIALSFGILVTGLALALVVAFQP